MHATPQLPLRQQPEPALHQIEPRPAGRREVEKEAWSLEPPPSDHGGLMGSIVVEDARPVQRSRDSCLNRVEDLAKFPRALPLVQLADALGSRLN